MYQDKTLVCKECGKNLYSQRESRSSTRKRALSTSRSAAGTAGRPARATDVPAGDVHGCVRRLRQGGPGSLSAPGGPPRLLQRVFCPYEGRGRINRRVWQRGAGTGALFCNFCIAERLKGYYNNITIKIENGGMYQWLPLPKIRSLARSWIWTAPLRPSFWRWACIAWAVLLRAGKQWSRLAWFRR